jgi:hypothetical protein
MIISSKPTHLSFTIFKPIFKTESPKLTKKSKDSLLRINRNKKMVPHPQNKENDNTSIKQIITKIKKAHQTEMLLKI